MRTTTDVQAWIDRQVVGSDDDKIGKVGQIYVDHESGEPKFLAVKTGLFGSNVSFVPIDQARESGDAVAVPYTKDQVKDAPNIDADAELSEAEEQRLYEHYDLDWPAGHDTTGHDTTGHDTSGPDTDEAMTRSEEELRVGTTTRETGRARLRKYVVTDTVEETVPVQREEIRVEREPITDANAGAALDGPEISEEEHEVTLHAEEPVVETRAVPKERVRLEKDTVTDEQTVSGEVRKERIETEGAGDDR
jgi:uncharacterized protein (TIGR02271 family)